MPFDGSGNYTPAAAPNFPAVGGTVINSSYYNAVINDIAAGLTNCLTRDGQGKPTADINWNAKSLTNVNNFGAVTATFSGNTTVQGVFTVTGASTWLQNTVYFGSTTTQNIAADTTTLYLRGGNIAWQDASAITTRMYLSSGGSLGIGTTSPIDRLNVSDGTVNFQFKPLSGSAAGFFGLRTNHALALTTNDTERLRVDTNGNVGIGTTSPTNSLHIEKAGGSIARFRDVTSGADTYLLSDSGGTALIQTQTLPLKLSTSNMTRLHIDAGGNVGIGTTSPGRRFDVVGSAITLSNSATYAAGFANAGGANGDVSIGSDGSYGYIQSFTKPLLINSQGNAVLFGPGNVGVGTSIPAGPFEVRRDQANANTVVYVRNGATGGTTASILQLVTGTASSYINFGIVDGSYRTIGNGPAITISYDDSDTHNFRKNDGTSKLSIGPSGGIVSSDAADAVGYKGLPQNGKVASYTLVLTDQGKDIYLTGSTAGQTITIPTNASVAFPVGTVIKISNDSNQNWTLASAGDTMVQKVTGSTTSRTIPPQCDAVIEKKSATRWWVSGAGLL